MSLVLDSDALFEPALVYPDIDHRERLASLVGLDNQIDRLGKILGTLVNPSGLDTWINEHHPDAAELLNLVLRRPPLVVLAGDVGSGKTVLAESIGDRVARQEDINLTLYPMSLSSRGQGRVGEMTKLITEAFDFTCSEAGKIQTASGKARGAIILLVDEADALVQSREAAQMHHEDRAGVNAFIRGIDRLAVGRLPAAVLMCTNRLGALDPAIQRRAAEILSFSRPTRMQRAAVIATHLKALNFSDGDIDEIVNVTGETSERDFGFTFSDLTQRFLPRIILDAYPNDAINATRAIEIAKTMAPTTPFKDQSNV